MDYSIKRTQAQAQTHSGGSPIQRRGSTSSQIAIALQAADRKPSSSRGDKEPVSCSIAPTAQREAPGAVAGAVHAFGSTSCGNAGGAIGSGTVNSSANVSACSSRRSSAGGRRRLANLRATTKSFCIDEELEERALIERLKAAQRQQTFDIDEPEQPVPEEDAIVGTAIEAEAPVFSACASALNEYDFDSRVVPHALLSEQSDKGGYPCPSEYCRQGEQQQRHELEGGGENYELADLCHEAPSSVARSNTRAYSTSPPPHRPLPHPPHLHPTILELKYSARASGGRLHNVERSNSGPYEFGNQVVNPSAAGRVAAEATSSRYVPRKFSVPLRHPQQQHPRSGTANSGSYLPPIASSESSGAVASGNIGGCGSHHRAGTFASAHSRNRQRTRAGVMMGELYSASAGGVRRRAGSSSGVDLGIPLLRAQAANSEAGGGAGGDASGSLGHLAMGPGSDGAGAGVQVTVTTPGAGGSDQLRGSKSSLHVPSPATLTVAIDEPVITTAQVQHEVEGKSQNSYSAFLKDHVTRFFQPGDNKLGIRTTQFRWLLPGSLFAR